MARFIDFDMKSMKSVTREIDDIWIKRITAKKWRPEEVFPQKDLEEWAIENDFVKNYEVAATCFPEDVFSQKDLEEWAIENGFTKSEEGEEKGGLND